MVKKKYDWLNGPELPEHTERKLKVLRDYFSVYLKIRCQLPQQQKFRLAIVDGFAGGERYQCGTPGSPIIFIEELERTLNNINIHRAHQGLGMIKFECLLILNDHDRDAFEQLKTNCIPILHEIKIKSPDLHIETRFINQNFETAYPEIKRRIKQGRYSNVLFNLDQCGTSHIKFKTLLDIMNISQSVEMFYTFMIESLLAYLNRKNPKALASQLKVLDIGPEEQAKLYEEKGNQAWLGKAERLVFENFYQLARYVSPFSINNPDGWRYWLMHFSNSYRGRQEYNMVLHNNSTLQVHFGRAGLNMLSYNPQDDKGQLYLFGVTDREATLEQLMTDIPKFVTDRGDAISLETFYKDIYNLTPSHHDDIHKAIIKNPDLEVFTPTGGKRREARTISVKDTLMLKAQKSFFPLFLSTDGKSKKS